MGRAAAFLAALFCAGPVLADPQSEVLFSHKAWQVMAVAFDDGSISCDAEVSDPGESFSIWIHQDGSVQLVFFSSQWDFGEGDRANLQVEIDRRSPWRLTDAELYQQSVLFGLSDADAGARFINEVARGNVLYLRTEEGEDVQSYSLAGSRAAIDALFQCGDALPATSPSNPFKN
ncbi:hypothetical protein [Neotabrizicola shimadae]|uniref:Uncharacterized protein n=1 Tax=Neotabrizicola shimadae TaxID=2807096 RepID=A0A8G1EDQ0_9RHOB|nr:hypothetical protein [Neotabrizicola shimadae]QYZ71742.1 hypothetical protein JO391_09740 [Neotabrizicola shimadae]